MGIDDKTVQLALSRVLPRPPAVAVNWPDDETLELALYRLVEVGLVNHKDGRFARRPSGTPGRLRRPAVRPRARREVRRRRRTASSRTGPDDSSPGEPGEGEPPGLVGAGGDFGPTCASTPAVPGPTKPVVAPPTWTLKTQLATQTYASAADKWAALGRVDQLAGELASIGVA